MKTVAVFFGGTSNEHEISVITGMYAVNLLRREELRVLPVFLPREGGMALAEKARAVEDFLRPHFPAAELCAGGLRVGRRRIPVDVALNCCHGGGGEGGVLAALLEWYAIPSASPAMTPSAVFLDKWTSKLVLMGLGLPVLPAFCVREEEEWRSRAEALGYPLVVKPCKLGSSIGISVVHDEGELEEALSLAFRLDDAALVERYLAGKRDLNCAARRVGGKVELSPVEEVFSEGALLTFGEKYEGKSPKRSVLPAVLPAGVEDRIRDMLLCVYEQFGMRGVVRGDFLLAGEELCFNELNTVPGTLASHLFGGRLSDAKRHILSLLEEALRAPRPARELLQSGILSSPVFGSKLRPLS